MSGTVPRKTRTRANKAVDKIRRMQAEIKNHTGTPPTRVRVCLADHLALVECNYVRDGVLSGTTLEVMVG